MYRPVAALLFQSLCFMAMFPCQYFWPIRVAVPGNCGEPGMGRGQRLVHWVSHKSLTTLSLTAGLALNRHSARTISGQNGPWLTNPTAVCSPLCFISVPTLHRWKKWSKKRPESRTGKTPKLELKHVFLNFLVFPLNFNSESHFSGHINLL